MKMLSFIAAAFALLALPGVASAAVLYGKVEAGYGVSGKVDVDGLGDIDLDSGYQIDAAIGYATANGVRFEGELVRLKNDIDGVDAEVKATALMANVYYEFGKDKVRPFVGAGIGWSKGEASASGGGVRVSTDDDGFAYQLKAGLSFAHSERTTWDLGYRYIKGDYDQTKADVHGVTIGLRFKLGA